MEKERKSNIEEKLSTYLFYASVLFFLIAFNFQDSKTGGWYQQWLPTGLGNSPVKDMVFQDSLTGWIIAGSPYLLKTTNGGDNWLVNQNFGDTVILNSMEFLGRDTIILGEGFSIYKSTNGGLNFLRYKFPPISFYAEDIAAFSYDSIWVVGGDGIHGGIYLTTNGGLNWVQKYLYNQNQLDKIYFYNHRIGFCCSSNQTLKTTNGGNNWFEVLAGEGYTDIHFVDSLTGWKAKGNIKKTTNGGINWVTQILPQTTAISSLEKFSFVNRDTIWGVGGNYQFPNYFIRGIIYKTTNGGINWGYQVPDTSYGIQILKYNNFANKRVGWAYVTQYGGTTGVHTIVGGNDSTIYSKVNSITNNIPKGYVLEQNYPNPFNSMTNIKVQMVKRGFAEIKVFDLTGRLVKVLMKQNLFSGEHIFKFDAFDLKSGVYFYTLYINGDRIDTKKMIMIK